MSPRHAHRYIAAAHLVPRGPYFMPAGACGLPNSAAAAVAHWASRAAASHAVVHNHRLARRPPNGYLGRGVVERTVASFF